MSKSDIKVVQIICDNESSWINDFLREITEIFPADYKTQMCKSYDEIVNGDIAVFLSCEHKIPQHILMMNKHNLIVHESSLPNGRGWSPLTWQILEGRESITSTLFEAEDSIDAGKIYYQEKIELNGTELVDELRQAQVLATKKLLSKFISLYPYNIPISQSGNITYYKKRYKKDSELDINLPLIGQFNLLRVVDNKRYPAFFYYKGEKFTIHVFKEKKNPLLDR
jgi:methionyl-tRNA formyltransferase